MVKNISLIFFILLSNYLFAIDTNCSKILVDLADKAGNLNKYDILGVQNELSREFYETKYIKLNNLVLDIDTENKVLKSQVAQQKEFFTKILETQTKQYEVELTQQTLIYSIAFGGLTIIAFILNWVGYKKVISSVNKTVKQEHQNAIKEMIDTISNDKALKSRIEALVKIEMEKHSSGSQSFEGGVQ